MTYPLHDRGTDRLLADLSRPRSDHGPKCRRCQGHMTCEETDDGAPNAARYWIWVCDDPDCGEVVRDSEFHQGGDE